VIKCCYSIGQKLRKTAYYSKCYTKSIKPRVLGTQIPAAFIPCSTTFRFHFLSSGQRKRLQNMKILKH